MKNIKFNKQLLPGILIGLFLGIAISLVVYYRIAPSSQTIEGFLNQHYYDYPIAQYKKYLFSAIQDDYLLVFYENKEGSYTSAIFETKGADWSENYLNTSGVLRLPGTKEESQFPTIVSAIRDKNETYLYGLAWGFFYNPSVKNVEVNGGKAEIFELNDIDNLKLWFKVVEFKKKGSIKFLDKNNNLIKKYNNDAIQGKE